MTNKRVAGSAQVTAPPPPAQISSETRGEECERERNHTPHTFIRGVNGTWGVTRPRLYSKYNTPQFTLHSLPKYSLTQAFHLDSGKFIKYLVTFT